MIPDEARRPFALTLIATVYVFSLLTAASSYGNPFPFMGSIFAGKAGEAFVLADSIVSLYLVVGILKRQRLTLWLLLAYNAIDICNALVNVALVPAAEYARLAGGEVPVDDLRVSTFAVAFLLAVLTAYVFANRRHFNNPSPYLF